MIFGVATVVSAQDTTSTSTQQSDQYRTDDSNTQQDTTSTTSPQDDQYRTNDSDTEQDTTSTAQQSDQYRTSESSTTSQPADSTYAGEGEAEMISTVDLPATVREQLTSEDYSGWTVSQAHRKVKDGVTYYKVELVNGDEKKKVKFDSQGNVLKEKDHSEHTEKAKDKY